MIKKEASYFFKKIEDNEPIKPSINCLRSRAPQGGFIYRRLAENQRVDPALKKKIDHPGTNKR